MCLGSDLGVGRGCGGGVGRGRDGKRRRSNGHGGDLLGGAMLDGARTGSGSTVLNAAGTGRD